MKNFSIAALFLTLALGRSYSTASFNVDLEVLASIPAQRLTIHAEIYGSGTDREFPHEQTLEWDSIKKGRHSLNLFTNEEALFRITEIAVSVHVVFSSQQEIRIRQILDDCNRLFIFLDQDFRKKRLRLSGWPRNFKEIYGPNNQDH